MGKRLPYTPKSKIRNALRRLFLQSRERAAALKRDGYTCQRCGKKQSRAKGKEVYINAHHKKGICNWDAIFDAIYKNLLCRPDDIEVLCVDCHKKEGEK